MKIKWVKLKEDDPICKSGFIISSPNVRNLKKVVKNEMTLLIDFNNCKFAHLA